MVELRVSLATRSRQIVIAGILPLIALGTFLFYGFLMLPMAGFEADEVMFAYDLGHPRAALAWFDYFGGHEAPYMLMSYLGALKTWLYAPLLAFLDATVWSIRTPVLLAAAVTIVLTGWLLRRISGWTSALIIICLLSTDIGFEVTAVFDWGPVVLQNLLLVVGLILIVHWHKNKRTILLFWAGLVFGLDVWNKALFLWNLSGMALALLVVALPDLVRLWRVKRAILFLLGFCLGAAPVIVFNIESSGTTISANAHSSLGEIDTKPAYLRRSLDGETALIPLIAVQGPGLDRIRLPRESTPLSRAARAAIFPSNWRFFSGLAVLFLGLIAAPSAERRWILFFLVSGAIGWFESALTHNAGTSIHHEVLFWIDWYCAIALGAACLARLRGKIAPWAVGALIVILTIRGIFTENAAYAGMISFGPNTPFTNADQALNNFLLQSGVKQAVVADWGIVNVIGLLSKDKIVLYDEEFQLNSGVFDRGRFPSCVYPSCVVITHTPDRMMFPVAGKTLDESLRNCGLTKTNVSIIDDTHGLPVFSVFSFEAKTADSKTLLEQTSLSGKPSVGTIVAVNYPRSSEFRFWATAANGPESQNELVQSIHWSVPGVEMVEIHVASPTGTLFAAGGSAGEGNTGPWAKPGLKFYLQDARTGDATSAGRTLATLELR
jgi:hypothetical protein